MAQKFAFFDLDGTLTFHKKPLDTKRLSFIKALYASSWHLGFLTGSSLSSAEAILSTLDIPYFLAIYNGADLFFKGEKIPNTSLEDIDLTPLWKIMQEYSPLFLTQREQKEEILFYPSSWEKNPLFSYIQKRSILCKEELMPWEKDSLPQGLISVKYFMDLKTAFFYQEKLAPFYYAPVCKDPLNPELAILQIVPPNQDKGSAVFSYIKHLKFSREECFLLGSGDDYNDIAFLEKMDLPITFDTAPFEVKKCHPAMEIIPSMEELPKYVLEKKFFI